MFTVGSHAHTIGRQSPELGPAQDAVVCTVIGAESLTQFCNHFIRSLRREVLHMGPQPRQAVAPLLVGAQGHATSEGRID